MTHHVSIFKPQIIFKITIIIATYATGLILEISWNTYVNIPMSIPDYPQAKVKFQFLK